MASQVLDGQETFDRDSLRRRTITREGTHNDHIAVQETLALAIVEPGSVHKLERDEVVIIGDGNFTSITDVLEMLVPDYATNKTLALDLETTGLNALKPGAKIAGVGLSSFYATVYFHTINWEDGDSRWLELFEFLSRPDLEFIGHNSGFDMGWLVVKMGGFKINWKYDTLALYRQLASEGYMQQLSAYKLKVAQLDLLGWDSAGDEELDKWLALNGYHKGIVKEGTTQEELLARFNKGTLKAKKSAMSNAPAEILGYYCALDAYSTRVLYSEIFRPCVDKYAWAPTFWEYHALFMRNLVALVEQYLNGINIDRERLTAHLKTMESKAQEAKQAFMQHPDIAPHIERYRADKLEELARAEPPQFLAPPKLGTEPAKFTKKKTISKTWESWEEKRRAIAAGELTKPNPAWFDWERKYREHAEDELFNIDSTAMKQWLFFGQLKLKAEVVSEKSGRPSVGKAAIKSLGIYGKLLQDYTTVHKEAQMTRATLAVTTPAARIHPQFKAPGTFTGRLAGGAQEVDDESKLKFNIQQIPKRREYLSCYIPDPGFVFVDCDHTALEPVVLTALSKDPVMMSLYGPNAKKGQDIYLYVGANLPGIGKKIRAAGFDPEFPTQESLDNAKKVCKLERAIAKTIVLGATYGMGPKKLRQTLFQQGINMYEEEAYAIHQAYWNLFKGVKKYQSRIENEYHRNGGWLLNAVGRPVCCDARQLKDLQNRVIQSSGHDIHMMFIDELLTLRDEVDFPVLGAIWDFHDQSIVQVPEERAEDMVAVYYEAYKRMNQKIKRLNPDFVLDIKGVPAIVPTFAEAKVSE